MSKTRMSTEPTPSDKQTVREWFYTMPLVERGKVVLDEFLLVLPGQQHPVEHQKLLPDYCYNIFDVFRKTVFKGYPSLPETVQITDQAAFQSGKTIEDSKRALHIDWKNLGRICGIALRCIRFTELEAKDALGGDGFDDSTPDKVNELFTVIFGKQWVETNQEKIATEPPGKLLVEMLNEFIASHIKKVKEMQPRWDALAFAWSPEAMIEFKAGMAEGTTSFLDVNGEFAGESRRAGIYWFLLFAWSEIKVMLEANPKKTLSDLREWMEPFMWMGIATYLDTDQLQDVCERPPKGIGLSLRPLKSRLLASP